MLQQDYDLSREDVQLLASRDALVAFFATLGYDTNVRLMQNMNAMGISNEALRAAIKHIERLANREAMGLLFEVYLFELKSVTVAATQAIARSFRDRPGDYLLVLTSDYEELDFVLVQRYIPPKQQDAADAGLLPAKPTGVSVQPRILTVTRRNPEAVALRVLRRFSYTEQYPFEQYEKLLSAYEVADWSEQYFNNRALFSDYYLKQRLPERDEWKAPAEVAAMTRAFKTLRTLYADAREEFSRQPEHVVRTKLLEPVLAALGFTIIQPPNPRAIEAGVPPNPRATARVARTMITGVARNRIMVRATLAVALGRGADGNVALGRGADGNDGPMAIVKNAGTEGNGKPLAVCLAYAWGRNLDGRDDTRDVVAPDENPGAAVVTLLDEGQADSNGVDWAIVTNGKLWRLYAAKAHSRATNYYEIDLEETLAMPEAHLEEAFRYFWLLFRASAFVPTPISGGEEGRQLCFLDTLLHESERYARELGDRLKDRVFEQIFPHFARGFIQYARRVGTLPPLEGMAAEERSRALEPFFSGTLTFLYRLLFLLYAESRDLLPMRELHGYFPQSLEKLKDEIAEQAQDIEDAAPLRLKDAYNELSTACYDRLQQLFQAVDKGEAELNVPVYNGGLFVTRPDEDDTTPEANVARFLATHKIPDRQLALGLDLMARDEDEKTHALAMIDYKSLGVRQLGSIYEGLLEFKLRVAPEEVVVVKGKKTEEIVPYAEAQQQKLAIVKEGRGKEARDKTHPKGYVYLENDRRERKATGSYYTPDYIVKYIVEHTVGPVLQEKLEGLRPLFREAEQTLRAKRAKHEALLKQRLLTKGDDPERETYHHYRETLNEAFFDLKVLDPAMGSGHFLVEAVDYITDQMAKFLTAFKWNPVVYGLAETRRDIQQEMERQGVTIDMSKLTDLNLLKRSVLKRCIYGVDLNPMAVELAKVSLWLDCFTLGAPLSFLDHHMKPGNSLIGGNVQEVQLALSQNLWGSQFSYLLDATQLMRRVGELSDVTAQEVAESRKAYKGAYDALVPFKRLLHVWTSEYFGNKGAKGITQQHADAIFNADYTKVGTADQQAIATALTLAQTKRFFHWELEFPEVFYGAKERKQNGGFDAVVGNPPYVRQEGLGEDKPAFKALYEVFNGIADLYTYFIERGNKQLRQGGRFGMITANKFMRANYGAPLRSFLTSKVRLEKLIDFGDLPVFGDATTYPIIILSANAPHNGSLIEYALLKTLSFKSLPLAIQATMSKMPVSAFSDTNWSLAATSEQGILDKLKSCSLTLGEYVGGKIQYGVKTGFNEAFIIDLATRNRLIAEDPRSADVIKPLAIGEDVRRYGISFEERYLIFTRRGINLTNYKAIERYLSEYRTQLEPRPLSWDDKTQGKWLGRKSGPYKWYEIQDNVAYYTDFEKPRIIYQEIATYQSFAFETEELYCNAKCFIISTHNLALLALLNSKLIWFWLSHRVSKLQGGAFAMQEQYLINTPIHRINFITSDKERAYYLEKAKNLYEYCLSKGDQQCVLGFVEHHLSKEPEESDVVHDLLALLAEEMLRLNKEKRAATREFLDWLVMTLHILPDKDGRKGIDALTGKSKLADYAGDYQKEEPPLRFEELRDILLKNKTRLGVSLSDAGLLDRLRSRYEGSLEQVLPIKDRLAKTDALIDRVVYRLYGLTDEEIAVVEGRQ